MKRIFAALTVATLAMPAHAQETAPPSLQQFLEGLLREMEPALEGLQGLADDMGPSLKQFMQQMGPALGALADQVEDWSLYEAPEILENGDIVIRRKPKPEVEPEIEALPEPLDI